MEKSKEKNMKITRNWINVTKYFNKGIDNDKNIKKRWPHTKKQTEITKRQKYAKKPSEKPKPITERLRARHQNETSRKVKNLWSFVFCDVLGSAPSNNDFQYWLFCQLFSHLITFL